MKVLLADDSDLILERLKEMLSIYEQVEIVASLKNGTETLEALRVLKPDLAIVDIKMPGLSGLEVLNEIRKEDKTIKFIILTFIHLIITGSWQFNRAPIISLIKLMILRKFPWWLPGSYGTLKMT